MIQLKDLERLGCQVTEERGELVLTAPPRTLGREVISELRAAKADLLAELRSREWQLYLAEREAAPADPRPDLTQDHPLWERLLGEAMAISKGPESVWAVLHGLRCLGARLVENNGAVRLTRGDEMPEAEYTDARRRYLLPIATAVTSLLRGLGTGVDRKEQEQEPAHPALRAGADLAAGRCATSPRAPPAPAALHTGRSTTQTWQGSTLVGDQVR